MQEFCPKNDNCFPNVSSSHTNLEHGISGQSSPEVELPACKIVFRRIAHWSAAILCTVALALSVWYCARVRSLHAAQLQLNTLDASYAWDHTWFRSAGRYAAQKWIAGYVGEIWISEIAYTRIHALDASDADLACLSDLKGLRRLDLHSNQASDATLKLLSQLPKLEHVRISGTGFTRKGLLQLRDAPSLKVVEFEAAAFTPNEVALLQTELHGRGLDSKELQRSVKIASPVAIYSLGYLAE